ncbi:MAG: hypothetical protein RI950_437 [Bacteroidota bacterium]|jgi:hypothetical protein
MKKLLLLSLLVSSFCLQAQMINDPSFDSKVLQPFYKNNSGPKVLIDGGHHNFFVQKSLMNPFVDLVKSDGYNPQIDSLPFTKKHLATYGVVVLDAAFPFDYGTKRELGDMKAYSTEEIELIYNYVNKGGSLLILAEKSPMINAMESLLNKFGITASYGTIADTLYQDKKFGKNVIHYSKENGRLTGDHPILKGRNASEEINHIVMITGSAFKGKDYTNLLPTSSAAQMGNAGVFTPVEQGSSMGLAGKVGKGKLVVLSDTEIFIAMLFSKDKVKVGMQMPEYDLKQFALNIMHWLSK